MKAMRLICGEACLFRALFNLMGLRSFALLGVLATPLAGATVGVTYHSSSDVAVVAASYTAAGNDLEVTLDFAPQIGTSLTVVRITGLGFIQGEFSNLAHGQTLILSYRGLNYRFIADYNAHEGRDLVLRWANEKPVAWGGGADGKLGNQSEDLSLVPEEVKSYGAVWGKTLLSGAAGGGHTLGLCSDGTVLAWGLNTNGQLGNNSTAQSYVAVEVSIPGVPGTRRVVALAAGQSHSLALCSDGKVYAWGLNASGQLGINSTAQSTVPVAVSISGVLAGRSVVAISAGANHSLALCSDGTAVAWGKNTNGQLGNNSTAQSNVPVAVNTSSSALTGKSVVAVSAGSSHSLALCSDGTVAAWGLNSSGQLGDSSFSQRTKPVAVSTGSGALNGRLVKMVSAGGSHSLTLCTDGAIAAWGANGFGQLGNGINSESNLPVRVSNSTQLNGKTVFMVSAGMDFGIAACTDGTVATWGSNLDGQLGNGSTSPSNTPTAVLSPGFQPGGFTAAVSGSSGNHAIGLFAKAQLAVTNCGINKTIQYCQSGPADPTLDPDSPYTFNSYANGGAMGELLATSTLTLPVGATGGSIYEKGSMGLNYHQIFNNKASLDAAYPAGFYVMHVRSSVPQSHDITVQLSAESYPSIPKVTSFTNAAWVNGVLKVTNPANDVTINWANPGAYYTWYQIDGTSINDNFSGSTKSFTIPGNTLSGDSLQRVTINFSSSVLSSEVPEIPGCYKSSSYNRSLRFLIQVGDPEVEDPMYLLLKNHTQNQSSNDDPVDLPNTLPDSDLAPYSMSVESPVGGILSGPSSTSFPLGFYADSDGNDYEYYSGPAVSPVALNQSHPNGTYTFPGGVAMSLAGDGYPSTAKLLTVNGASPVWNDQGYLVLDPSIDNTITWSPVDVPNFATQGHQFYELENYQDFNFEGLYEDRGAFTPFDTPSTSMFVPKFMLTATYTYLGSLGYAAIPSVSFPAPGVAAVAGYETTNQFMVVAHKPQTLTFGAISGKSYPDPDFDPGASASSGLPVSYEVVSGPAEVVDGQIHLTGAGTVTVRASQEGTGVYASAASVTRSFAVGYDSGLAEFRRTSGLADDGSGDLLDPASDKIPNLFKYAFNMIGSGTGQAPALSTPNHSFMAVGGFAGLPRQGMNSGKLAVTYIRRKASSNPGVNYAVEFSAMLSAGSWSTNGLAVETVESIDADFERVTVTDNAAHTKRFARVQVTAQ